MTVIVSGVPMPDEEAQKISDTQQRFSEDGEGFLIETDRPESKPKLGLLAKRLRKEIDDYAVKEFSEPFRTRLGSAAIGRECKAELWFSFRWCTPKKEDGRQLRLFKRGEREEAWLISLLKGIGCVVKEKPTSNLFFHPESDCYFYESEMDKFGITDDLCHYVGDEKDHVSEAEKRGVFPPHWQIEHCEGHFGGRLDFVVELPEHLQKEFNVFEPLAGECKTSATGAPFNKVRDGIEHSHPVHAAQNDIYGLKLGFRYGLYITTNKNDDDMIIHVREIDIENAHKNLLKAEEIVYSNTVPEKISNDPTYFKCRTCLHKKVCHAGEEPVKNCRSCVHSKPVENGEWFCTIFSGNIPKDFIPQGCDNWDGIKGD